MRVMSGTLLMPVWTLRSWRPQSLISHKQVYREAVGIKPVASRISGTKVTISVTFLLYVACFLMSEMLRRDSHGCVSCFGALTFHAL